MAKTVRVIEWFPTGRWELSIEVPDRYVVTSGNQLRSSDRGDPAIELRQPLSTDRCASQGEPADGVCDEAVSRFFDVAGEEMVCRVAFLSPPSPRERDAANAICNSVVAVGAVDPHPPSNANDPELLRPGEPLRLRKLHGQSSVWFTVDAPRGYREADVSRIETHGNAPLLTRGHGDPLFTFRWAWPKIASCEESSTTAIDAKGTDTTVCPGSGIDVRHTVRSSSGLELVCWVEQDAVLAPDVREQQVRDAIEVCKTLKFLDVGPSKQP